MFWQAMWRSDMEMGQFSEISGKSLPLTELSETMRYMLPARFRKFVENQIKWYWFLTNEKRILTKTYDLLPFPAPSIVTQTISAYELMWHMPQFVMWTRTILIHHGKIQKKQQSFKQYLEQDSQNPPYIIIMNGWDNGNENGINWWETNEKEFMKNSLVPDKFFLKRWHHTSSVLATERAGMQMWKKRQNPEIKSKSKFTLHLKSNETTRVPFLYKLYKKIVDDEVIVDDMDNLDLRVNFGNHYYYPQEGLNSFEYNSITQPFYFIESRVQYVKQIHANWSPLKKTGNVSPPSWAILTEGTAKFKELKIDSLIDNIVKKDILKLKKNIRLLAVHELGKGKDEGYLKILFDTKHPSMEVEDHIFLQRNHIPAIVVAGREGNEDELLVQLEVKFRKQEPQVEVTILISVSLNLIVTMTDETGKHHVSTPKDLIEGGTHSMTYEFFLKNSEIPKQFYVLSIRHPHESIPDLVSGEWEEAIINPENRLKHYNILVEERKKGGTKPQPMDFEKLHL